MGKENNLALGISEPEKVDAYFEALNHPMKEVAVRLRNLILSTDKNIGEGIYWNAPTFYYTGKLEPFNPKEYKRYLTGYVINKKDRLVLVFLKGAYVSDPTNILEGKYADGRRIMTFTNLEEVSLKEKALQQILNEIIQLIRG